MKIKLLLAFCLMIGLLSAGLVFIPSDTLHFNYVMYSPTIDATHEYDEGECSEIINNELTTRYCYYKDDLYFYFFISDSQIDDGDYFYLGFDTSKNNVISKGEPRIIIYRNGTIVNPDNWPYDTFTTGRGGWRGEILVPFVDVGLPTNLGPGKSQDGPNIRLKAVGGSEGSLGTFYGTGVGETNSISYWSQPQSITVKSTSFTNPTQEWVRETDNNTIKMLEFAIPTNNEEPFNINYLVFDATGTGHEQDDIEKVELYKTVGPTTELVGSKSFNHDDGNIIFPVNFDVQGTHVGAYAPIFQLYYVMNSNAGSVYGSAASFRVDLTSVPNVGTYTAAELNVNNLPFKSGSLFTYDCATDSGCTDSKFCDNRKCTDVIPGVCGYAANHIWNDYECCSDTDCSSGDVCSDHACIEESIAPPPEETDPGPEPTDPIPEPVIAEPPLTNVTAPPVIPEGNDTTNDSGTPPGTLPDDSVSINNTSTTPQTDTIPDSTDNQTEITAPKPSDPWMDDTTLLLVGAIIVIIGGVAIYYYKFKK